MQDATFNTTTKCYEVETAAGLRIIDCRTAGLPAGALHGPDEMGRALRVVTPGISEVVDRNLSDKQLAERVGDQMLRRLEIALINEREARYDAEGSCLEEDWVRVDVCAAETREAYFRAKRQGLDINAIDGVYEPDLARRFAVVA